MVLSRRAALPNNPIPAALDSATAKQITEALISLQTSFSHPLIDLDGVLLDSGVVCGGDGDGSSGTSSTFGHLEIHRLAVHSSLKILLCTSLKAKETALEGEINNSGKKRKIKKRKK